MDLSKMGPDELKELAKKLGMAPETLGTASPEKLREFLRDKLALPPQKQGQSDGEYFVERVALKELARTTREIREATFGRERALAS